MATATKKMPITGDPDADQLLMDEPLALLLGMLLDQQVPMEWAFLGPSTLRRRLGHLDASRIAAMDEEAFVAVCCDKPAIHRFPAAMGRRRTRERMTADMAHLAHAFLGRRRIGS